MLAGVLTSRAPFLCSLLPPSPHPCVQCYAPYFQIGQQVCVNGTYTPVSSLSVDPSYYPYKVQAGDSLTSIAKMFLSLCPNVTTTAICAANALPNCGSYAVTAGQMLLVPCAKGVGSTICAPSITVCGATYKGYNSACDMNLDSASVGSTSGSCSLSVATCTGKTGQLVTTSSTSNYIVDGGACRPPSWSNADSTWSTQCKNIYGDYCTCLNRLCTVACVESAATWRLGYNNNLTFPGVTSKTVFNTSCMNWCVNLRTNNTCKYSFVRIKA